MQTPSLLSALPHILQHESVIIPFVYQLEAANNAQRSSTEAVPEADTLTFWPFQQVELVQGQMLRQVYNAQEKRGVIITTAAT